MKMDGKDILKRLSEAKKNDRAKISLYLSKGLYDEFREKCGKIPASLVMEDLMKAFVDSLSAKTVK